MKNSHEMMESVLEKSSVIKNARKRRNIMLSSLMVGCALAIMLVCNMTLFNKQETSGNKVQSEAYNKEYIVRAKQSLANSVIDYQWFDAAEVFKRTNGYIVVATVVEEPSCSEEMITEESTGDFLWKFKNYKVVVESVLYSTIKTKIDSEFVVATGLLDIAPDFHDGDRVLLNVSKNDVYTTKDRVVYTYNTPAFYVNADDTLYSVYEEDKNYDGVNISEIKNLINEK